MSAIQSAHTQRSGAGQAAADLRVQLAGTSPRLVLYFASPSYPPAEIAAAMEAAFAPATVIGCTTAGELTTGAMLRRSVVAMALPAAVVQDLAVEVVPGLRAGAGQLPVAFDGFERHFGRGLAALDPARHVGLVLFDGMSGAEERVMEALGARTDMPFVGGSAGDDLAFKATHVFAGGRAHADAALLAVLRVDGGYGLLKTQSFTRTGRTLTASRVREQERLVEAFDGRPAAEAYAAALEVPADQLPARFMTHPLGLIAGDEPFVRSPQQVTAEGVKFYCAIAEGMELEVLRSGDIVEGTRQALEAERARLGGVQGIVNFNCILRTLELEQKGQLPGYGALFAGTPTVGFSTYGEAYLGHINQTATLLLFR